MMNAKVDSKFFANMRINVNSEFYILVPEPNTDRFIFSEVYAIGHDQIMEIVDLGYWTRKEDLVLTAKSYFLRRRNFRRQVLRTASIEVLNRFGWGNS